MRTILFWGLCDQGYKPGSTLSNTWQHVRVQVVGTDGGVTTMEKAVEDVLKGFPRYSAMLDAV